MDKQVVKTTSVLTFIFQPRSFYSSDLRLAAGVPRWEAGRGAELRRRPGHPRTDALRPSWHPGHPGRAAAALGQRRLPGPRARWFCAGGAHTRPVRGPPHAALVLGGSQVCLCLRRAGAWSSLQPTRITPSPWVAFQRPFRASVTISHLHLSQGRSCTAGLLGAGAGVGSQGLRGWVLWGGAGAAHGHAGDTASPGVLTCLRLLRRAPGQGLGKGLGLEVLGDDAEGPSDGAVARPRLCRARLGLLGCAGAAAGPADELGPQAPPPLQTPGPVPARRPPVRCGQGGQNEA